MTHSFSLKIQQWLGKVKAALGIKIRHTYGTFSILLPADHRLPFYQKHHRLYDKFLPHLSRYLPPDSTVIDVGANCGDTLAGMYGSNSKIRYICIEPDDEFYKILESNILRIKETNDLINITPIKSMIGKSVATASLVGVGGTKRAAPPNGKSDIRLQSLDNLFSSIGVHHIDVLKSDVDGFDYDVLDSGVELIEECKPILFFECQQDLEEQKTAYKETISRLFGIGYTNWILFDNFGEVVVRTDQVGVILDLFDYVFRQNKGQSTRTIFYFDILAFPDEDREMVNLAVNEYIKDR